jgi:hypothetical protein
LSRVLSDIISGTLLTEPNVEVRTEAGSGDAVEAVRRAAPDVAIVGDDSTAGEHDWERVLRELPGLKVLTILDDGRQGFLYELRPCRVPLGEVSPQTLLDAVRRAKRSIG